MDILFSINTILIPLILAVIGYVARKTNIMPANAMPILSKFILYVGAPASLITTLQIPITSGFSGDSGIIFLIAAIFYAITIAVGWFLPNILRAKKEDYGIIRFSVIFAGFLGVPIISSIFGETGAAYTILFGVLFIILTFTFGIWILLRKTGRDLKTSLKCLLIPSTFGIIIGLIFFFTSITIPDPFASALSFLGDISIPLTFFTIGGFLANIKIKNIFNNYRLYITSLVSLLLLPFLLKLITGCIITDPTIVGTTVIIAAMPASAYLVVLAEEFKLNSEFAAQCVFIMTLMSVITIPIVTTFWI